MAYVIDPLNKRIYQQEDGIHNSDSQHDCEQSECPPPPDPELIADFSMIGVESEGEAIRRGLAQAFCEIMNILNRRR